MIIYLHDSKYLADLMVPWKMRFVGIHSEIDLISSFVILGLRNIALLPGLMSIENMLNLEINCCTSIPFILVYDFHVADHIAWSCNSFKYT